MYKKYLNNRNIFIIAVSAAFIAVSVIVAMLSVNIYETIGINTSRQELTQATQYISVQLRKSDGSVVRTAALGGDIPALVIESYGDGIYYETWYFAYGGYLKEATVKQGDAVKPQQGTNIIPLKSASFAFLRENLVELQFINADEEISVVNYHLPDYEGGVQ